MPSTTTDTDPDTITPASLARLVALHLRLSGADADEVDLEHWLTHHWPAVVTDMDPGRLALAYRGETTRSS